MPEPGADAVDLATSVGYLLKQAAAELRAAMEEALRPLGLSVTQYSCLELLAQRPGSSNSDLARGAFVTRQSMHALLLAMQREGLVERPPEAAEGRALPARLTADGAELARRASAVVRDVERRMTAGLGPAEEEAVRRALLGFVDALARGGSPATGAERHGGQSAAAPPL